MKKVLFYYSANIQTVYIESQILLFKEKGFDVSFITSCEKGIFHERLESNGVKTYAIPNKLSFKSNPINYISNFLFLIYFIRKNNFEVVIPHLHLPCFVSSYVQYFTKAQFIFFRHNCSWWNNEDILESDTNRNEQRIDQIINKRAKKIVVPSEGVKNFMIEHEEVKAEKIEVLHYIYKFNLYQKPNDSVVELLKEKFKGQLRLIMVSRMVKHKRHQLVLECMKELIVKGLDIQLILLDEGPEKEHLKVYVNENNLNKHVHFIGFTRDFINYMEMSDVLIQPSMTDASNNVFKEMGLLSKAVIVSENVADYSEYIHHNMNGFLVPIKNTKTHLIQLIEKIYSNEYNIEKNGLALRETIIKEFSFGEKQEVEYKKFFEKFNLLN
jgi:glycosyltransferase involved in cell wall biosynthesis